MMKTSRRGFVTLAAAACSLVLAGCTGGSDEGNGRSGFESRGVFEEIQARSTMASRVGGLYGSIPEAMPQVRYIVSGDDPVSVADAYVVGDLVSVDSGRTFQWTVDPVTGEETRREVPCIVLAYHGQGRHEGDNEPYRASIASTYVRRDGAWQLALTAHQPWKPNEKSGSA